MLRMLRQGEDEAQVQMLQWENFVIAQEKMQMFRGEVQKALEQATTRMADLDNT